MLPNVKGKTYFFKDFRSIFIPILKTFGRKRLLNFPEIKFHFTFNAINQVSELKRLKSNVANAKLDYFLLQVKKLPISSGKFEF